MRLTGQMAEGREARAQGDMASVSTLPGPVGKLTWRGKAYSTEGRSSQQRLGAVSGAGHLQVLRKLGENSMSGATGSPPGARERWLQAETNHSSLLTGEVCRRKAS